MLFLNMKAEEAHATDCRILVVIHQVILFLRAVSSNQYLRLTRLALNNGGCIGEDGEEQTLHSCMYVCM